MSATGFCNPCSGCTAVYKTVSAAIYCTDPTDPTCGGLFGCTPQSDLLPAFLYNTCSPIEGLIAWINEFASTLVDNPDVAWGDFCTYATFTPGGSSPTEITYNNAGPCWGTSSGYPASGWGFNPPNAVTFIDPDTWLCPAANTCTPTGDQDGYCAGVIITVIAVKTNCPNAQINYAPCACCHQCQDSGTSCSETTSGPCGGSDCNNPGLGCWESQWSFAAPCIAAVAPYTFALPVPPYDTCHVLSDVGYGMCDNGAGESFCAPNCSGVYSLLFDNAKTATLTYSSCEGSGDPFGLS